MRSRGNYFRGISPNAPQAPVIGPEEVFYTSALFNTNTTFQPRTTANAVAGDILFVAGVGNTPVGLPSSTYSDTNNIGGGGSSQTNAYKVLSAGDITTNSISITCPSLGNFVIIMIRGITTITRKQSINTINASDTVPGFTKAANSKLILITNTDRTDVAATLATPTGFTLLRNGSSQYFSVVHGVRHSSTYTNGSNFAVFTQATGGGAAYGAAISVYEAT